MKTRRDRQANMRGGRWRVEERGSNSPPDESAKWSRPFPKRLTHVNCGLHLLCCYYQSFVLILRWLATWKIILATYLYWSLIGHISYVMVFISTSRI